MSAELLREAARLMRERAEAARDSAPKKWDDDGWTESPADWYEPDALSGRRVASVADSAHIASWHPAVALAVAGLLKVMSQRHDYDPEEWDAVEDVARAYLDRFGAEDES